MVFYEARVGAGVLALIPAHANCIPVGKRSGRHSKDQDSINDLLLSAALSGKRVVRLKCGNASIFGRMTEEITHLRSAGIDVRICPGITAASAPAASLGVSLPLRVMAMRFPHLPPPPRHQPPLALDSRPQTHP